MLDELLEEIQKLYSKERSEKAKRFFKTGKGEYSESDIFLGLTVPEERKIASKYAGLSISNVQKLLDSKIHEHRMIAGIVMNIKSKDKPEEMFNLYMKNAKRFNNWDLVDMTAAEISGKFLLNKSRRILYDLAKSKNIWERRIAIVSTYTFIKNGEFGDTLKISEILFNDKEDLIHKATGWMLREVGKREIEILKDFLQTNYGKIPRTTLRYAIERFPKNEKEKFLRGKFE